MVVIQRWLMWRHDRPMVINFLWPHIHPRNFRVSVDLCPSVKYMLEKCDLCKPLIIQLRIMLVLLNVNKAPHLAVIPADLALLPLSESQSPVQET